MARTRRPTKRQLAKLRDDIYPLLTPFFTQNPVSSLDVVDTPANFIAIGKPWGDSSVGITIVKADDPVISVLNSVYLPERFTAIWHLDNKKLEIIFTADPLPAAWADLSTRAFVFRHRGKEYNCYFGAASDRLEMISIHAMPRQPTRTGYRNLLSFQRYYFAKNNAPGFTIEAGATPLSFWIEGLEWDDASIVDIAHHLNLYMSYYDNISPLIIIHTPEAETAASPRVIRYPFKDFPKTITSRTLDENLMQFWIASREGDPFRRFIYNFQILEYAANYYIDDNVKRAVRRNLSAPNALDDLDNLTRQVIEALGETKMMDPQKLEAMVRNTVEPKIIWSEIANNIAFFATETRFDGGFIQPPLISVGWGETDFQTSWIPAFPNAIRAIRNALSHGREQRTGGVILPTTDNFARLQAWVPLVAAAAREVMVYRELA